MFKSLPVLYKKSTTGSIEAWAVDVEWTPGLNTAQVVSTYGQLGGKMQTTLDVVDQGKNIGKANETNVLQQALAEAKAKWEKKKKKGYVESIEAARAGEVDELIEGGVEPMLAHKFSEKADKIVYPCLAQPKLDGIRCIAIKKGSEVTLWSRTRKRITSCPHVEQAIAFHFANVTDIILDGELYNHDLKHDFEKIVSAVRKDNPTPESQQVQYHIYDIIEANMTTLQRARWLTLHHTWPESAPLVLVRTEGIRTAADVAAKFLEHRLAGYEGTMLRNNDGLYEHKRSNHLQKVKEFDDAEFEIVGITEGKGRLKGHAIHICKAANGNEFDVKLEGDISHLKEHFEDSSLWRGKKMTVQFQGLTGKKQVPRFPVGLRIRDEGL
jgi:DNA ligase-1